jgi:ribosomal protein L29
VSQLNPDGTVRRYRTAFTKEQLNRLEKEFFKGRFQDQADDDTGKPTQLSHVTS